jgi:hypothetical protein
MRLVCVFRSLHPAVGSTWQIEKVCTRCNYEVPFSDIVNVRLQSEAQTSKVSVEY